jgi:hypothetical protein
VKSGGYIKRYTRLKKRRERARRLPPDVIRDEAHLARVRAIGKCVSANLPGARCKPGIQAAHRDEGKAGGRKTSDLETVPQCCQCHTDWGTAKGPFKDWDKARRRLWFVSALEWTRQRLGLVAA